MNRERVTKLIESTRRTLQLLEEEVGINEVPAPPKRREAKSSFRQQLEENEFSGTWKKPVIKHKKTGGRTPAHK